MHAAASRWVRTPSSTRVASGRCCGIRGSAPTGGRISIRGRFVTMARRWATRPSPPSKRFVATPIRPRAHAVRPSAAPKPVAGRRYTLRFSDCFGTLSRSVWCSHQWWEASPPVGTQYVKDGVLHLVRRRSDGYPNVTVSSEPCGQATPRSFRQGYFEARMRWTGVPGSGPAFWLFSTAHAPIRGGRSRGVRSRPACRPRSTCSRGTGTTSTCSPARSTAIPATVTANRVG